jgi:hypothetical protein
MLVDLNVGYRDRWLSKLYCKVENLLKLAVKIDNIFFKDEF